MKGFEYTKMKLVKATINDTKKAMQIINMAKKHLKEQDIDQWQNGYPDINCITNDTQSERGFFVCENEEILAYLYIDFSGEPAYENIDGEWLCNEKYVVVHRMAISENARGKRLSAEIFRLVEDFAKKQGVYYFRVDTDEANLKMQHILKKNGFEYRGKICFDNSEKIAFDKKF